MATYQFDFTVVTDGEDEAEALEEAMQLLADYHFAKEAATVRLLDPRYGVQTLMAGNDTMFSDIEVTLWAVVDQISDPEQAQIIMAVHTDPEAARRDADSRNTAAPNSPDSPIRRVAALSADLRSIIEANDADEYGDSEAEANCARDLLDAIDAMLEG